MIILFASLAVIGSGLIFFSRTETPSRAIKGVVDISDIDFARGRLYKLNGQWKITYDEFTPPSIKPEGREDQDYTDVPGNWNRQYRPTGFATYSLSVLVPEGSGDLMLLMPSVSTAYKLYVNGRPESANGMVSQNKFTGKPEYRYEAVKVRPYEGKLEILIHVSNYVYCKGGMWNSPVLGSPVAIERHFSARIFTETLIAGGLFLVGIILISLFVVRREYTAYANLGLFCLIMAIRTVIVGEIPLTFFFPGFNWELMVRMEYLTMPLGFITINSYFFNIYRKYYKKIILWIFTGCASALAAFFLIAPLFTVTALLLPVQLLLLLGIIHFFYLFLSSGKKMKEENLIIISGISILLLMVILDMLMANNYLRYLPVKINTSVGLLILIFSNSILLIRQAARTSRKMQEMTVNLENIVNQRTTALEEANRKLSEQAITDILTGTFNRHEFSRVMKNEDARHHRSDRNYAALYLDLDNFKFINDTYGHPAGDLILKETANMIKSCIRDSDYLFRMGGDEFFILMTEIRKEDDAVGLARRLLAKLEKRDFFRKELEDFTKLPVIFPKGKCFSMSIGISCSASTPMKSLYSLPVQADKALLSAKAAGKNRYALYEDNKA